MRRRRDCGEAICAAIHCQGQKEKEGLMATALMRQIFNVIVTIFALYSIKSQHCTRWEGDLAFSSRTLIARRGEFWLACENWVGLRPRQVPTHFPHSSDQSFTFMISQVGTGDIIIIIIISMTMKVIFTTSRSMILHILWKMTMRTMTKSDKWQFHKFSHLAISQSRDTWPINTSDKTIIEMCSLLEFDKFGVNSPVSAIPTNQVPDPRFF